MVDNENWPVRERSKSSSMNKKQFEANYRKLTQWGKERPKIKKAFFAKYYPCGHIPPVCDASRGAWKEFLASRRAQKDARLTGIASRLGHDIAYG